VTFGGGRAGWRADRPLAVAHPHPSGGREQHEHRHPGTSRERTHREGFPSSEAAIRAAPGNAALRQQLFQHLWPFSGSGPVRPADLHCRSLDPSSRPTVLAYRGLAEAEIVRQAVFCRRHLADDHGEPAAVDAVWLKARSASLEASFPGHVPRRGADSSPAPRAPHAAGWGGATRRGARGPARRRHAPGPISRDHRGNTSGSISRLSELRSSRPSASRTMSGLPPDSSGRPAASRHGSFRRATPIRAEPPTPISAWPEDRVHRRRVRHEPRAWAPHAAHRGDEVRFSSLD